MKCLLMLANGSEEGASDLTYRVVASSGDQEYSGAETDFFFFLRHLSLVILYHKK